MGSGFYGPRAGALSLMVLAMTIGSHGCAKTETGAVSGEFCDAELENLVRGSYQYVAIYNVRRWPSASTATSTGYRGAGASPEVREGLAAAGGRLPTTLHGARRGS